MKKQELSVDEVVDRIKVSMRLKISAESEDRLKQADDSIGLKNELRALDFESKCNNLNWDLRIETPITSHRKFIGPVLIFGRKFVRKYLRWYINPPLEQQKEYNASVTRSINWIRNILHTYDSMLEMAGGRIGNIEGRLQTTEHMIEKFGNIEGRLQTTEHMIQEAVHKNTSLEQKIRDNEEVFNQQSGKIENLKKEYLGLSNRYIALIDTLSKITERGDRSQDSQPSVTETSIINGNMNYFAFEKRFRGDRQVIKEAFRIYLDFFKGKKNVLDIGCGRGEFLELLKEHDICATGIDIDGDMVRLCQERGLSVVQSDLFDYLAGAEDGSFDGIFSAQVIEHIDTVSLLKLISLARLKLKPSGILMLETINPGCLIALANSFYMDLTHVRPVHPLTLQYLLDAGGYRDVSLLYSCPAKDYMIPRLKLNAENGNIDEFNESMGRLNQILYGSQHYAAIGYR